MISLHDGQCGLCTHFGETDKPMNQKLIQIHSSKRAPEDFLDDCGHPKFAKLHLKVTPMSGCDGFVPAAAALDWLRGASLKFQSQNFSFSEELSLPRCV